MYTSKTAKQRQHGQKQMTNYSLTSIYMNLLFQSDRDWDFFVCSALSFKIQWHVYCKLQTSWLAKFLKAHGVSVFILQSAAILGIMFHRIFMYFGCRCPDVECSSLSFPLFRFAEISARDMICASQFVVLFGYCAHLSGFIGLVSFILCYLLQVNLVSIIVFH